MLKLSKTFSRLLSTDLKGTNGIGARPSKSARFYVYELLHTVTIDTRLELYVKSTLTVLIVLNLAAVILETVPTIERDYGSIFYGFELGTVLIFSAEYVLRVWSIVENEKYARPVSGRIRYMFSFFAVVDLLAIMPFYLPAFVSFDLRFLRGFRLLRLLRILKLGQYSNSIGLLTRVAKKKKSDIAVSLSIIVLLFILAGCMLYFVEHGSQPDVVTDIPSTIWYSIAKLAALDYATFVPATPFGKAFDAVLSFLGLILFALPSGIIAAGFIEEIEARKKKPACPHCGKELQG